MHSGDKMSHGGGGGGLEVRDYRARYTQLPPMYQCNYSPPPPPPPPPPHGIVEVCGSDCGVSADNMLRNSTSEEVQITHQFLSSDLQNNRVCIS